MAAAAQPRVAAITGASTGIGRALASELAQRGYRVGLLARRADLLEEAAEEVRAVGGTAAVAACDVTDRTAVLRAFQSLVAELGPVDLLVANAGVGRSIPVDEFDAKRTELVYRVNVFGALAAIAAVLPSMLERGRGHIVGISSLSAYRGHPVFSAYAASKAALNRQLEGMRIELAPRGIWVTTVCPGYVHTPMTADNRGPMPFVMDAPEAARRIARAIERKKRVYNFPWQTSLLIKITGLIPDFLYDRLRRP